MTELQKQVATMMKKAGIAVDACTTAMSNLKTEEQQKKMLNYLQENPTATNRQMMLKVKEIIGK